MLYGELVRGKMLGHRTDTISYLDKTSGLPKEFVKHEIGIGIVQPDGFGGFSQQSLYLRLSEQQMQKRLAEKAKALVGKIVEIPFDKSYRSKFDRKVNKEVIETEYFMLGEDIFLVAEEKK